MPVSFSLPEDDKRIAVPAAVAAFHTTTPFGRLTEREGARDYTPQERHGQRRVVCASGASA
ncbi:MAG TPA: hypothetical protein VII01_00100 [Solirubrobacteraceae bacterium]